MEVDIDGSDLLCLKGLRSLTDRPRYLSIGSNTLSLNKVRKEFDLITELGYGSFKIVPRPKIVGQRLPIPTRKGQSADPLFEEGSSGLFGEDAPGHWVDAMTALPMYRPIFLRYRLVGDYPVNKNERVRELLGRYFGFVAGWNDAHARMVPPESGQ